MYFLDVNVLIYAHRVDYAEHSSYSRWLSDLASGDEPFALAELVMSAFLRIVTNRKIFKPPTPMRHALDFLDELKACSNCRVIRPSSNHWPIFVELLLEAKIKGPTVTDAYLAALAIENNLELISSDKDFARFGSLRWRHPLEQT